ncbi:hypothetical protein GNP80_09795 [Aliivibrio fischeri]|uniref:hypothetical protein n=1 Tax=Aliivibrio fischeri TaxID=668 RepID=UPI0012D8FA44|nr:hypothetical protein [Aliivibrio fischeri]MUK92733.1 hypothetical protein [Aliivibrio fischeri]
MITHSKKRQIFFMFLISCIALGGILLFSLSSSIENKNNTILRLTEELRLAQLTSSSLKEYDDRLIELQNKNNELKEDLSVVSETLVENNLIINKLQQQLNAERRKFTQYKSRYNKKMKTQFANEQKRLNAQLEKERIALQSQESELEVQRKHLEQLQKASMEDTSEVKDKKAIDEERVEALMKQFNAYQVDLTVKNKCDKSYLYRYNEAKSTLNHIRTYLQKNQMDSSYYHFVIANDASITSQNRELCLED